MNKNEYMREYMRERRAKDEEFREKQYHGVIKSHAKTFIYKEADFGELIDLKNMIEHRLKEIDNDTTASI